MTQLDPEKVEDFFETARLRERIRLSKESGHPWPWTNDPIFQEWRFCNVRREDDKTTVWFRENIRDPLKNNSCKVVEATVIFRWFNRIEVGEKIKDLLLGTWNSDEAHKRLQGVKPVVTGAYMRSSPMGYGKLEGVLQCVDAALLYIPAILERRFKSPSAPKTLEEAWKDFKGLSFMGPFGAYEVVSDLRWTSVLSGATDIMTWAHPGPGCCRGLRRVVGDEFPKEEALDLMRDLLEYSRNSHYWPEECVPWEMREVEHWLCEYDKICRARFGSRLKRRYQVE